MFIFYTLLYIALTYLSYFFNVLGISLPFTVIRESYFIYLFFLFINKFLVKDKTVIRINIYTKLMIIIIVLSIPYVFFSNNLTFALKTFYLYFSGPILFVFLSSLHLSDRQRRTIDYYLSYMLCFICLLNILFYFVQNRIVINIREESFRYFYRYSVDNGAWELRYLGIALHPTITGFFFIYCIGYFLINGKKISGAVSTLFLYFTGTRSAVLGIPLYILLKIKKVLRLFLIFIGILIAGVVYYFFTKGPLAQFLFKTEPSAWKHLYDFFVLGPTTVIKYPFGSGLGSVSPYNYINPIIHIESEMYLYMIQLGFIGFAMKSLFYIMIIKKLRILNTRKTNWLLFILLSFLAGNIVFPLNDLRFISNFVWIILGIEFSKDEYKTIQRKNKVFFLKYSNC